MDGQNIKQLLPSDIMDQYMSIQGKFCQVERCNVSLIGLPRAPRTFFNITLQDLSFPRNADQRRICYLLDLANGLSHSERNDGSDSLTMLKVKRMIDTMLKSVEFVLKADAVTGGGIAELRSIPDSS